MAVTRLGDMKVVPELFSDMMTLESLELDEFVQSGIAVVDEQANAFLANSTGGKAYSPRYLGPLPNTPADIASDDPTVKGATDKLTAIQNTAVRQSLSKAWSSMDLVANLAGKDPLAGIQTRIAKYWLTQRQGRVLSSLKGVVAESVLSHESDMVIDVTGEAGAASLINQFAILDAATTMGDRGREMGILALHSVVYNTLQKLNLIQYLKLSDQNATFPSILGYRLVIDDAMTVETRTETIGENEPTPYPAYYSYLFGPGSVALGYGRARVPFEVDRDPSSGNNSGQETVYSRQEWVIHPQGYSYKLATGGTPTTAMLEEGGNWERAWERKRIPLAAIITRG
jgi:hypothetical protein